MIKITKLLAFFVTIIYLFGASIWMHAFVMNNSSDMNTVNCTHFASHHNMEMDPSNDWAKHDKCLDSIYIGYKVHSWLSLDILYKYSPIIFDYKVVYDNLNFRPIINIPPPIYDSKYLKFSDLIWIIILLN